MRCSIGATVDHAFSVAFNPFVPSNGTSLFVPGCSQSASTIFVAAKSSTRALPALINASSGHHWNVARRCSCRARACASQSPRVHCIALYVPYMSHHPHRSHLKVLDKKKGHPVSTKTTRWHPNPSCCCDNPRRFGTAEAKSPSKDDSISSPSHLYIQCRLPLRAVRYVRTQAKLKYKSHGLSSRLFFSSLNSSGPSAAHICTQQQRRASCK